MICLGATRHVVGRSTRAARQGFQARHVQDFDLAVADPQAVPIRKSTERTTDRFMRHAQVTGDVAPAHREQQMLGRLAAGLHAL